MVIRCLTLFVMLTLEGPVTSPAPDPPEAPPYLSVPYAAPFSAGRPMGVNVVIDSKTGVVTGIAPDAGIYVMTVCVSERRNGVLIATQRKDLQIKVGDCSLAAANLPPQSVNCLNFTSGFANTGDQALIHSYLWNFGDPSQAPIFVNPCKSYTRVQ